MKTPPGRFSNIEGPLLVGFVILLGAALLLIHSGKPFSLDELLTFYQVHDKRFAELGTAAATGWNLMPRGYFILMWVVLHTLGSSELVFRMPSAIALLAIVPLFHRLLKGLVGARAAFFAVIGLFSSCSMMIVYGVEARPYTISWLILTAILYFSMGFVAGRVSWPAIVANAALNFLLPFLHYTTAIYSTCIWVGVLFLMKAEQRRKIPALMSFFIGWLAFGLTSLRLVFSQVATNHYGTHLPPPTTNSLRDVYGANFPVVLLVGLAVFCIMTAARDKSEPALASIDPTGEARTKLQPAAVFGALLCCPPFLVFLLGRSGLLSFWDERYFWGTSLGMTLVLAAILRVLEASLLGGPKGGDCRWGRACTAAAMLACGVNVFLTAHSYRAAYKLAPVSAIVETLDQEVKPGDGPIVAPEWNTYFYLLHYSKYSARTEMLSDDEQGVRLWKAYNRESRVFGPHPTEKACVLLMPPYMEDQWPAIAAKFPMYGEQRRVAVPNSHFATSIVFLKHR